MRAESAVYPDVPTGWSASHVGMKSSITGHMSHFRSKPRLPKGCLRLPSEHATRNVLISHKAIKRTHTPSCTTMLDATPVRKHQRTIQNSTSPTKDRNVYHHNKLARMDSDVTTSSHQCARSTMKEMWGRYIKRRTVAMCTLRLDGNASGCRSNLLVDFRPVSPLVTAK